MAWMMRQGEGAPVRNVITVMAMVLGFASMASAQAPEVRRLTVEDAVRLALENNLGVRAARIDPPIQDLGVAQARAAWHPILTSTLQGAATDSPSNSFLSGAQGPKTSDDRVNTNVASVARSSQGMSTKPGADD